MDDSDYVRAHRESLEVPDKQDAIETVLGSMAEKIIDYVSATQKKHENQINSIKSKIGKCVSKMHVKAADQIDYVWTTIQRWLSANLDQHEWELTQLGVKTGLINIGQGSVDLDIALDIDDGTKPEYIGRLCLWIDPSTPGFSALLEVLREIRDRMPATAVALTGQIVGKGDESESEVMAATWPSAPVDTVVDGGDVTNV